MLNFLKSLTFSQLDSFVVRVAAFLLLLAAIIKLLKTELASIF